MLRQTTSRARVIKSRRRLIHALAVKRRARARARPSSSHFRRAFSLVVPFIRARTSAAPAVRDVRFRRIRDHCGRCGTARDGERWIRCSDVTNLSRRVIVDHSASVRAVVAEEKEDQLAVAESLRATGSLHAIACNRLFTMHPDKAE